MPTTFFKKCNICLSDITFKKVKLSCKHVYHEKCIAAVVDKKCPVCKRYIFNRFEQKLLKGSPEEFDFTNYSPDDALALLDEAIKRGILHVINMLLKLYDPSTLMMRYIEENNVKGVKILLKSKHLNYHATKNNKTIMDMAKESTNHEIKQLLNLKMSPSFDTEQTNKPLYPKL